MRQPNDNHFVSARGRIPFGSRANLALIGVALIGALLGVTLGPASATTEGTRAAGQSGAPRAERIDQGNPRCAICRIQTDLQAPAKY